MSIKNTVVILILIGIISLALSPLWQKPHFIERPLTKKDTPDFSFKSIKMSLLNEDHKEWVINADYAEIDKTERVSYLDSVSGTVYLKESASSITFVSPKATLDLTSQNLYLTTPKITIFHFDEPLYISAKRMFWDSYTHQLNGQKDIVMRNKNIQLVGNYFEADLHENKLVVSKKAHATIKVVK